jgi:hypothetical protein
MGLKDEAQRGMASLLRTIIDGLTCQDMMSKKTGLVFDSDIGVVGFAHTGRWWVALGLLAHSIPVHHTFNLLF